MYKVALPMTGATTYAGMTGHQFVALGLGIIVVGSLLFKMARFKIKDSK